MVNYLIVNFQKRIEFINECNCIVDLNELEQAILWYQSKPTSSVKKIYLHGNCPAVSIHNQKNTYSQIVDAVLVKHKITI